MEALEGKVIELAYALDTFYFLVMGAFVMWMAAGFTMLESGLVRAKNTAEILTKNISLYSIAVIMYMIVGYNLMYPGGGTGVIPELSFFLGADNTAEAVIASGGDVYYSSISDHFFQVVFVATAMSVVSGAVAERKKLWTFLLFAVIFTAVIYPIQGSWSWGGGWLSERGFFDFAGSGIVHMAGAAAALAGVLILGPRRGKYTSDGKPRNIQGANAAQVALGTLILWLGWFGFNGGSQLALNGVENANAVAKIFVNTNTAAAAGVLSAMALSKLWLGKTAMNATMNGALAGLVVITADPLTPAPHFALLYGALGGLLVPLSMTMFEREGIDDPVGAISVHGVAGILGLLLVPILNTNASFLEQIIGTLSILGFVFISSYGVWWFIDRCFSIRVSEKEEVGGSDMYEAGGRAYEYMMADKD